VITASGYLDGLERFHAGGAIRAKIPPVDTGAGIAAVRVGTDPALVIARRRILCALVDVRTCAAVTGKAIPTGADHGVGGSSAPSVFITLGASRMARITCI
jgi:hypothetical protein